MTNIARRLAVALGLIGLLLPGTARADKQADLAAGAAKVLRQRCAECHSGAKARGGVNLDYASRLQESKVILKNDHQGSELWQLVECGTMPPGDRPKLSAAEVTTLREWIDGGAPEFPSPYGDAYVLKQIREDFGKEGRKALGYRYVSFSHLLGEGANALKPEVCKAALTSALNHLSMMNDPVRPIAIDDTGTIFRIDLTQLGWETNPFEKEPHVNLYDLILLEYPFAVLPESSDDFTYLEENYLQPAHLIRPIPYVRGDWLVTLATQPPLYEDLLDLPRTLPDAKDPEGKVIQGLETMLKVEPGAIRGGVTRSQGKEVLRLLERRKAGPGPFWRTYELGGKDLTDLVRQARTRKAPAQVLFGLPNGLNGYYLADKSGQRLETAPADWIHDKKDPETPIRNGLSCIRCHVEGVQSFTDVVGPELDGKDMELRELFPGQKTLDERLKADRERYTDALKKIHGGQIPEVEPIGVVSDLYRKKWANVPMRREVDPRGPRLREEFPLQPPLLDRLGKPLPHGASNGVPILPLDGLTLPQYAPADARVEVEFTSEERKRGKTACFRAGQKEEMFLRIKNKEKVPIHIELIGISLDSGRCYQPLIEAGTIIAAEKEARFPSSGFLDIPDVPGKDLYILFASRTPFSGGRVLASKSDRFVGDRFVHRFYEIRDGKRVLPPVLIKKTIEVEVIAEP